MFLKKNATLHSFKEPGEPMQRQKWIIIAILFAANLSANCCGDWMFRLSAIYAHPFDDSGALSTLASSGVDVDDGWGGEVSLGYMIMDQLSVVATVSSSTHDVHGEGALAGTKVGSVMIVPCTVFLQYYITHDWNAQPYVGVGFNYTPIVNEDCAIASTSLSAKNSYHVAFNGGMDWQLTEDWTMNAEVKFIIMNTEANLKGATEGVVDIDINPLIVGVGLTRVF